jgi:hypothetical protein
MTPADITLAEHRKARHELAEKITLLVREYEAQLGMEVEALDVRREELPQGPRIREVAAVYVRVEL